MKVLVQKGKTSYLARVFIQDSSKSDGSGLTGLTSASAGLVCYRARDDDGNAGATQITLSGGTRGTWSSGGFVEKDATNMPGWYELGIPNNALATGSDTVDIMLKGASNMAPCPLEIQLVGFDPTDAVRLGLTALPNAAAGANGGLPLSVDTSGRVDVLKVNGTSQTAADLGAVTAAVKTQTDKLTFTVAGKIDANVYTWNGTAVAAPNTAGVPIVDTKYLTGTLQTARDLGANLDAAVSSRLATSGYTAPDNSDIATILSDVVVILNDVNAGAGALYSRIGTPAGASIAADIAAVKSDTGAVKTKTDQLAFTVSGKLDAGAYHINGDATAAANLAHSARAIGRGTVNTGASTSAIPTSAFSPVGNAVDQFKGRVVLFDSDTATLALRGVAVAILGSTNAATPTLTVAPLPTSPAAGDSFNVL